MHGVGVAEEVVHVAEDFLIGSGEEHSQIVGLALSHRGEHQEVGAASLHGYEVGYLSVGVACHVLQRGHACGLLVKARERHDGEELVDGPMVGQRLE